jgi:hypothetical protein
VGTCVSEEQAIYKYSIEVNRFYRKFAWKVVIHFHNRKTGDSPVPAGRKGINGRVR